MKLLVLRYAGNLSSQEFVVSDQVAEDVLAAFVVVKDASGDPGLSPVITIVDEARPLPPLVPDPKRLFRRSRRQWGVPDSRAAVDLSLVASVRIGSVPDSEE